MLFTLTDIATQIAPQTFESGWQWFTDGAVTAPNVQRGGEIVSAVVAQAGGRPLRVYVRVLKEGDALTLQGECTCTKRNNCEHVVAVLLQALKDRQALPETPSGSGRVQVHTHGNTPDQATPNASPPSQVLLYVLRFDEDAGIAVEPNVARPRHQDGHTLGQRFEPGKAPRGMPARFLQPVDLELLSALDRVPRNYSGALLLNGPGSDWLLESLLTTGRCHLSGFDSRLTPLRLSAARPIRLEWLCDEAAVQRLNISTDPECERLLLANTWYLDSTTGECGPVEGGLPSGVIRELLALPPVTPAQVKEVSDALVRAYPRMTVPLPRSFKIKTLPYRHPVPCLCLTTQGHASNDSNASHDFARLCFDYGGVEFDYGGRDTRLLDGRVLRVARNRQVEQTAVQQLCSFGLAPAIGDPADETARFVPASEVGFNAAGVWLDIQADHLPALREQGWRISYQDFRYRLCKPTQWTGDIKRLSADDWFNIGLGIEVEGQRVDLLPILLQALREMPRGLLEQGHIPLQNLVVPLTDDQHETRLLRLPAKRLVPLLQILLEIYGPAPPDDADRMQLSRVQLARLTALDTADWRAQGRELQWLGDTEARQLIERLRDLDGIAAVTPPAGLLAELRPYQREGLNWLQFLREFRFGGILADDMGLGKTLQALAHLLVERASGRADRPSLVVAPTSLVFNWRHEAQRFAPQLKVLALQGPRRSEQFAAIAAHDLVITTYPLLARDRQALLGQAYHLLILDEAQVIKNPKAQASRVVRALDARHRLCLTGTPMENHLGELWSLFDAVLPGLLGDSKRFARLFRTPIEKHHNDAVAQRLRRRIRPFLLRRTKQQVAAELPDKTEIVQRIALDGRQRELYETVRLAVHGRVRSEIERQGLARSQIVVLDALLKLRQVCCDPRLVDSEQARAVGASAKLEMLMQLLPEMVAEGRRILLFSQFTSMLSLIEESVNEVGIDYLKLTGRTRDRQTPVQRFQAGAAPLFLISLKAGGVGLNLTAADTVIHYDPWWNPAVERQATDRAHRIGQRQAVFVYKLICSGTVEEKMQAMQQRKLALADGLYQRGGQQTPQWGSEDLEELFGPLEGPVSESNVSLTHHRNASKVLKP